MKITTLKLNNVRSFDSAEIACSPTINIIVGKNNAGKSTILRALYLLQKNDALKADQTLKKNKAIAEVEIFMSPSTDSGIVFHNTSADTLTALKVLFPNPNTHRYVKMNGRGAYNQSNGLFIRSVEPQNAIYPYFSRRKAIQYNHTVNATNANRIESNLEFLFSKIDNLVSRVGTIQRAQYLELCNEIFGFGIVALPVAEGKAAGFAYGVGANDFISVHEMGEGIINVVGLLVDLLRVRDRVFLIEEIENDIHPQALKALLDVILEASEHNQIFITTHSNIVLKHLGSQENAKIFRVEMALNQERIPTSTITLLPNTTYAKREVLEELGYEFSDYGLWKGWLILEESSAEKIIREHLIPIFVPALNNRLRTYSANSLSQVEPAFVDFKRVFTFLHLEDMYQNRAWILIDGGEKEEKVVVKLREKFPTWPETSFQQLQHHDFEQYYPTHFREKVATIATLTGKPNRQRKREAKIQLVNEVDAWLNENRERAKAALEVSASEVIRILQDIAVQLGLN